jgi:hypothetical protein
VGVIIGGVVFAVLVIGIIIFVIIRRRRAEQPQPPEISSDTTELKPAAVAGTIAVSGTTAELRRAAQSEYGPFVAPSLHGDVAEAKTYGDVDDVRKGKAEDKTYGDVEEVRKAEVKVTANVYASPQLQAKGEYDAPDSTLNI